MPFPFNNSPSRIIYLFCFLSFTLIYACRPSRHYLKSDFRKNYADARAILHSDTAQMQFFKVHLKNGEVSVLNNWSLSDNKDSLSGMGTLYDFNRNQTREGNLSFAIDDIAIIETNQLDRIKSKDSERVAGLSILTGLNLIVDIVCLVNPKACFGSCPTFYIDGHSQLHSANAEGFSSSIAPALEKMDIDDLGYRTTSREFFLTMKNEALETHLVNELQVQAVAKGKYQKVFQSPSGQFYRCGPLHPIAAATTGGKDIRPALNALDEAEYFSQTDSFDLRTQETVILEFEEVSSKKLGVVINFRQTLVTTFLLYSGLSYMGDEAADYFARIETNNGLAKRMGAPFDLLGGIRLYVWNKISGKWQFFEELHETGPIARNLQIAPIPDRIRTSGKVKIKIEMAKGLWRLDYAGLSPIQEEAEPYIASPLAVEVIKGNATPVAAVTQDDKDYLVSFPGDEYQFRFEFPELVENQEYELFLFSKGYYLEWMRHEWIKDKDPVKLKKFLLNDAQTWRELSLEYKHQELQMESLFWNSKYTEN